METGKAAEFFIQAIIVMYLGHKLEPWVKIRLSSLFQRLCSGSVEVFGSVEIDRSVLKRFSGLVFQFDTKREVFVGRLCHFHIEIAFDADQ